VAHQPNSRGRGEGEGPPLTRGETIAAISTPPGRGGIGVVRVSGGQARSIALAVLGRVPAPRQAALCDFRAARGALIDRGIALFFASPSSYTGEDVLELQAHGGPFVMQQLLARCVEAGARIAQPGEFTRRAFLNDRLDLAQAESVADLIDAASVEAARSAARSLSGEFSRRVTAIADAILELRMHVEACIDFPEEEIDPADRAQIERKRMSIGTDLRSLLGLARQGAVLRDGLTVVLAGRPNVGKSSLLNALAGEDLAIVTPVPGTTRDYVRATISLEGVPIHLIDTAGLRESSDPVERIGIDRAMRAIADAGAALVIDALDAQERPDEAMLRGFPPGQPRAYVMNKVDMSPGYLPYPFVDGAPTFPVSAQTGQGMEALRAWLLETAGWRPHGEDVFMARERHLLALQEAAAHLEESMKFQEAFDLMAEELRLAHRAMGRITGEVSADDLLGSIFSRFCIGK
jgi:tRNA modification GTPase